MGVVLGVVLCSVAGSGYSLGCGLLFFWLKWAWSCALQMEVGVVRSFVVGVI